MDECIKTGVSTHETILPGRLGLRRRAPMLYRRLMRGFYPTIPGAENPFPAIAPGNEQAQVDAPDPEIDSMLSQIEASISNNTSARAGPKGDVGKGGRRLAALRANRVTGSFNHEVLPMAPVSAPLLDAHWQRRTVIPAMDFLSCYAIAVNEVNAGAGRIVTSPTNGAAGVIPAVLKYLIEFVTDEPEKCVTTFLLTASAVGMLFKRGSTISAAEGGCQAEVGVACSMASAGFAACMGGECVEFAILIFQPLRKRYCRPQRLVLNTILV